MTASNSECEQYVFSAYGKRKGAKKSEPVLIFESPLEEKGTLFMVETPGGEECASFTSAARGWEAMQDMRRHLEGLRITRISRMPVSERAGARLSLV